jgi:hypothetical protein
MLLLTKPPVQSSARAGRSTDAIGVPNAAAKTNRKTIVRRGIRSLTTSVGRGPPEQPFGSVNGFGQGKLEQITARWLSAYYFSALGLDP